MMRLPLLSVAALLMAAVSAPAQISVEARLGRHVRGPVAAGGDHHHDSRDHRDNRDHRDSRDHRDNRHEPVRRAPARPLGHWTTVHEQVLVPGYWRDEHVPPTCGWITDSCGHRRWGVVDQGGCRRTWVPARWETRCRQVWVAC
jgi:hypothetical protein